ncbi:Sensory histidine kinase QseC [plant metagenome]|uniref:histidine kinase n=1 Tax=plant metagenome TaxID=1297885 RepID=A0A484P6V2_9ZZZZ
MIGQMTVLTVLFISFIGYYFGLRPMLSAVPVREDDPLQLTLGQVQQRLSGFALKVQNSSEDATLLQSDPMLKEVAARNPEFHYYIRVGAREFGDAELSYFKEMQLIELDRIKAQNVPGACLQLNSALDEAAGQGFVSYTNCSDSASYYEYRGIRNALDLDTSRTQYYPRWLWSYSGSMLLAAAGVFLIFIAIVMLNVNLIRRVAALTRAFDPKNLEQKLPEKGLPIEVVPLVQAVNEMISKVDQSQKRHDFFLSTAAHEMRTPLTVLRTRLEMLDDGEVKDKLVGDVGRLTSLANQLLRLMSINGGRKLDTLVDLVASCQKVIAEREPLAEARGVALRLDSEVAACRVVGDADLIEVAIANLVDNALSFSGSGGSVVVTLDAAGKLSVRDAGPGIVEAQLSTLFEPFSKFPPNRNGHGLGLAIVKAVADLHGAQVQAENAAGGGAVFTLAFERVG